jgi:hypothetical protein
VNDRVQHKNSKKKKKKRDLLIPSFFSLANLHNLASFSFSSENQTKHENLMVLRDFEIFENTCSLKK